MTEKQTGAPSQWMVQTKRADFAEIAEKFHINQVTARIIRNRDVIEEEAISRYLYGTISDLYSPGLLPDMDRAVSILRKKIEEGKRIRVVGDYDIDGVCSTYILLKALKEAGAKGDYRIPDRIKDGYGINEAIIRQAAEDGIDTILTCDNGIAAIDQILLAKEMGMTVIVTDHHDIQADENGSDILPAADAVVNPKRQDSLYPYPEICGGMVAYKLMRALYESYSIPLSKWEEMMEFAAIATVGDVMKLQDENRIVVREGLKHIGSTKNLGLLSLIRKNNLDPKALTAYHIGFVIGPCLNAGGRLKTAKAALKLLLAEDREMAEQLAGDLKDLNEQRKEMTLKSTEEAIEQVESQFTKDKVLVIFLPDCHESLAGIVAGRLRERYQKPSFVLTKSEDGVKGSGRSIEAYHMFEGLVQVKDLLTKFGGHPMAAGFSLPEENVEQFRLRLNENAVLTEEDFVRKVWIDVPMPLEYIEESLLKELEQLEPFGNGNEKPQFAQKGLSVRNVRVLGKNRNAVKLSLVTPGGFAMDGMFFGDGDAFCEELAGNHFIDIVYYPTINEYNGNRTLQAVIKEYRFS
ncbi:MAG: single-stranded-DNA-specific exonuclease RecJ [Lachnospiraceae bacterium]